MHSLNYLNVLNIVKDIMHS